MSEEKRSLPPFLKKLRLKNILIIVFIAAFAIGISIEIYRHSNSRIDSILEKDRAAFDACAEYFRPGRPDGFKPMEADEYNSEGQRFTDRTSVQFIEQHLSDEPIAETVKTLENAGILKITVEGAEVKFFIDLNMGICYIDEELRAASPELYYYPQKYLDENHIDGNWYRFGESSKK